MGFNILIFVAGIFSICGGFLTEVGQQVPNGHHDSTSALLVLLAEERDLRHQLAEAVTQTKSEVDILKDNVTRLQEENTLLKHLVNEKNLSSTLQVQITNVTNELHNQDNKINSLLHTITSFKTQIQNGLNTEKLQTQNLSSTLQNVSRELQGQDNKVNSLQHIITSNQQEVQNVSRELQGQENGINSLQHILTSNQQDVLTLKSLIQNGTHNQHVAFSAYLYTGTFNANQPIVFNDVQVNTGGGYRNGIFHCPVAGLYMFSVTLVPGSSSDKRYNIMKNDTLITQLYTSYNDGGGYESGSVTFLTNVGLDDRIWVKSPYSVYYVHSRFTGMLIQP